MRSPNAKIALLAIAGTALLPGAVRAAEKAAFSAPGKKVVQPQQLDQMPADQKRALGEAGAKALLGTVELRPDGTLRRVPASDADAKTLVREMRTVESSAGAVQEQVFPPDQRTRVQATTTAPFRSVVDIDVGCSGTLIGPHHVLTAGHCVYDRADRTYYRDLGLSPAENGGKRPFGRVGWKTALVSSGYIDKGLSRFDFAVIVLKQDVGRRAGTLAYGQRTLSHGSAISILGYPGDKPAGTMWRSSCALISTSSTQLYYPCDTAPGSSGSPVIVGSGKTAFVVGVHTLAYSGKYNAGTRLSAVDTDVVRQWVKSH